MNNVAEITAIETALHYIKIFFEIFPTSLVILTDSHQGLENDPHCDEIIHIVFCDGILSLSNVFINQSISVSSIEFLCVVDLDAMYLHVVEVEVHQLHVIGSHVVESDGY